MAKFENLRLYLKQIHNTPALTEKEREKFFLAIKNNKSAEQARLRIIQDNLALVVSLAKKYYYPGMNIEFLDFIEEGNVGLIKAVEKYDITKGYKFSTYASWWIEKHFQDAFLKSRSIVQIPEKAWRHLKKIEETTAELLQQTGQVPDIKELSKKIDISITELRRTLQSAMKIKNVKSLDSYVDQDKTHTLEEIIPKDEISMDDRIDEMSAEEHLNTLMETLTDNERRVLELRFGIVDDKKHTYREIGDALMISPPKAKEMQETAIRKLKRMVIVEKYSE